MNNNFYEIPQDWYNEFNNSFMNSNNIGPNMYNMPNMMNMNDMSMDLADPKVALENC